MSFVILTWNSEKTIDQCLRGIAEKCAAENIPYEVLIVDNGSRDQTLDIIEKHSGHMPIVLLCLERNRGTTCTRNMALKQSTGDILCVLDSDTLFMDGSLRELVQELESDQSIGILAPRLIEASGKVQPSVKRFPSIPGKLSRIPKIVFKLPFRDYDTYPDFPFTDMTEVDCAISACWFFRRDLLDVAGFLDERIFYAPEDVDYCLNVRKKGKKVLYYPRFTVMHRTQQITHKNFLSRIAFSHLWGLAYYFIKHRYVMKPDIDRT